MKRISALLLAAASFAVPACSSEQGDDSVGSGSGSGSGSETGDEWDQALSQREYDYNAALRIAALRLTGALPTMAEIQEIASAPDNATKKGLYEARIQQYMSRPEFGKQMMYFWRDTFKMGETAMLDTAPAFATGLSINNGSYMDMFTASSGNCPTFDMTAGTVASAECMNGGPKAGLLTNPGIQSHYFGNLGFRRSRFFQETFVCTKFPAEVGTAPVDVGGAAPYTGVWPFQSIASPTNGGGRINFQDTSAVICANCHSTLNHLTPLFAYYDDQGAYQTAISVPTPLDGAPLAKMTDYLPAGETTAWRLNVPAADLPALGQAMAADADVAECGVARMWNWALGKTDIVDTLQEVPSETIAAQVDAFKANGFKMKDMIFAVYTSDDFVKF
ncbi:MAG TPA: DUF1549 domain-containing protein [Kofleriaceae bacterium]|nr:DUF1549 domain-containing protein [Kofleriaceae bacterium]